MQTVLPFTLFKFTFLKIIIIDLIVKYLILSYNQQIEGVNFELMVHVLTIFLKIISIPSLKNFFRFVMLLINLLMKP